MACWVRGEDAARIAHRVVGEGGAAQLRRASGSLHGAHRARRPHHLPLGGHAGHGRAHPHRGHRCLRRPARLVGGEGGRDPAGVPRGGAGDGPRPDPALARRPGPVPRRAAPPSLAGDRVGGRTLAPSAGRGRAVRGHGGGGDGAEGGAVAMRAVAPGCRGGSSSRTPGPGGWAARSSGKGCAPTTLEASWTYPEGEFVAFRGVGTPVRADREADHFASSPGQAVTDLKS